MNEKTWADVMPGDNVLAWGPDGGKTVVTVVKVEDGRIILSNGAAVSSGTGRPVRLSGMTQNQWDGFCRTAFTCSEDSVRRAMTEQAALSLKWKVEGRLRKASMSGDLESIQRLQRAFDEVEAQ